ncbi:hypothetical protein V5799_016091, partial [Amblyomma americanum]
MRLLEVKHTNWDAFRFLRSQRPAEGIADLRHLTERLPQDTDNTSKTVTQQESGPSPD